MNTSNSKLDPIEKGVMITAAAIMLTFLAAIVFAGVEYEIALPTCVDKVSPFTKGEIIHRGDDTWELHFVASMWRFDPPEVRLPEGAEADIYVTSADVTHGFDIGGTNVNLMVVPGTVNYSHIRFNHSGVYSVICHEYCGAGHQDMGSKIIVGNVAVAEMTGASPTTAAATTTSVAYAENAGYKAMQKFGCIACHNLQGQKGVGPALNGIFKKEIELVDGSKVKADRGYLIESIKNPAAKVAKGFQPLMPVMPLGEDDINHIADFLETLE